MADPIKKYVLRYAQNFTDGEICVDYFVKEGLTMTTDRDQALRFATNKEAWDYANQYPYPYPMKEEEVGETGRNDFDR